MTLIRCHIANGAVTMFMVVPLNKAMYPLPFRLKAFERLVRVSGRIFQGTKQALGVRVVVTDRRATEGGADTQSLQGRQHGCPLHWPTIIRVQYQAILADTFSQAGLADQHAGVIRRLILMHLPADDLAAEDIQCQVESVEGAPDTGGQ